MMLHISKTAMHNSLGHFVDDAEINLTPCELRNLNDTQNVPQCSRFERDICIKAWIARCC